jgi:hypothetical protein
MAFLSRHSCRYTSPWFSFLLVLSQSHVCTLRAILSWLMELFNPGVYILIRKRYITPPPLKIKFLPLLHHVVFQLLSCLFAFNLSYFSVILAFSSHFLFICPCVRWYFPINRPLVLSWQSIFVLLNRFWFFFFFLNIKTVYWLTDREFQFLSHVVMGLPGLTLNKHDIPQWDNYNHLYGANDNFPWAMSASYLHMIGVLEFY